MLFLAGRDRYTQRTLLRRVHDRLSKHAGCESVRYSPSRRRPRYVLADVKTAVFFGDSYDPGTARLEIRFWYPRDVDYAFYRLNWIEPERDLMLGFHRDADHSDLGPCHVQVDYEGTTVDRHAADFLDVHPLSVLEDRLTQLPVVLSAVRWEDNQPSLPESPV